MMLRTVLIMVMLNLKLYECISYENYTLYRAIPVNKKQLRLLENLPDKYDVQLWKHSGAVLKAVDFTISPRDKENFLREAQETQLYLTTISSNVKELFDKQTVRTYIRRQMNSFDWLGYYRADDIFNWLRDLETANPNYLTLKTIGSTVQNRPIISAHISREKVKPSKLPTVIVEGGIHAREWISSAFVTYLLYKVLYAESDSDAEFLRIAQSYNWIFVPLLNPDGYEFTHTGNRLWRKNLNGAGVDLNRNFDIAFGSVGINKNEKSEVYCGHKAFSERETYAMKTLVEDNKDNLQYYLAFHSYGQYIILPYAHLKYHVENYEQVHSMATASMQNLRRRYGTEYTIGTAFDTVGYRSSGVSGCWVKHAYRTPYVLTFELRDSGKEGFALAPEYILPTCEETVDGLMTLLDPNIKQAHKLAIPDESCSLKQSILLFYFIMFITLGFYYF